jgi:hypothetical protein
MSPASTTVEIAPKLAATNIGNMLVHQIGHSKPRHAAPFRRLRLARSYTVKEGELCDRLPQK